MNFPNQISGTFNKPISLGVGTLTVYKNNVLFLTFTEADIVVVGNSFTIDITNLFPDNADYYINFTTGLFYNSVEIQQGITDNTTWTFSIVDGEFDNTEFSTTEYLTN